MEAKENCGYIETAVKIFQRTFSRFRDKTNLFAGTATQPNKQNENRFVFNTDWY